jgi:1-acyl-sn-glycerol-3-phosphate acyltransferase
LTRPLAPGPSPLAPGPIETVARRGQVRLFGMAVTRRLAVSVEGLEHLPADGPVLVASRHFHHFYDAAVLMTVVRRPLHFLVALDWVHRRRERRLMEWACRLVRWPIVLRTERLVDPAGRPRPDRAYGPAEGQPFLRRAVADSVELLQQGRALVVFPEAYPNVDPEGSVKPGPDAFLPFRDGFARIAARAECDGAARVPIVPAGFWYGGSRRGRWRVQLRLGAPIVQAGRSRADFVRRVEEQVRALSEPSPDDRADATGVRPLSRGGAGRRPS